MSAFGDVTTFLGALAYRLFLSIAGEDRMYVCDGCRQL
jgi:hypothetical protein